MQIPPSYQLSRNITLSLGRIEKLKASLDLLETSQLAEKFMRQRAVLKSSLFSARIEGNPLTLEEIEREGFTDPKQKQKLEIFNLYKTLEFIFKNNWHKPLTCDDLKKIHNLVLSGISAEASSFRHEPSAIYNSTGVAVYICPLPDEVLGYLNSYLSYINHEFENIIPIKAALSHLVFEKIHPFLDGNGRVGRLLIHLILKKWGYDLKGLVPIEEYLEQNRQTYYDLLLAEKSDRTEFVEFFLTALEYGLQIAFDNKQKTLEIVDEVELNLPLRRAEILRIIRDHNIVSLDFIARRFLQVPVRTLRYDLQQLVSLKMIRKRGSTRGAVYEKIKN